MGLISVKDAREFYIFMEEAGGVSYFKDLDAILKRGHLNELDMERAAMLAHFIADIHALKYPGQDGCNDKFAKSENPNLGQKSFNPLHTIF